MLSRKTTKSLAEVYHAMFAGHYDVTSVYGKTTNRFYSLEKDSLYDFLYEHDYDAWFLNAAKALHGKERDLKEFIMRLHTGEAVTSATLERSKLGQRLLKDLAEDVLVWSQTSGVYVRDTVRKQLPKLMAELELDGYIFRDGKLYFSEAAVLDIEGEEGVLEKLIQDLKLENRQVMKHHLDLSETHYVDEKWDDSIANSRKFLESVLQEIAARHHLFKTRQPIDPVVYSRPVRVRDYLESQGLVKPKEKEAIATIYGLLSETGSHPYIAQKDQARLMRYLALTFAQFALLGLRGALQTP